MCITEWLWVEGTSGGHLGSLPAQAGPPRASCPGPCPDSFRVSPKDGHSAASLGNLCQCSVTLSKKVFPNVEKEYNMVLISCWANCWMEKARRAVLGPECLQYRCRSRGTGVLVGGTGEG